MFQTQWGIKRETLPDLWITVWEVVTSQKLPDAYPVHPQALLVCWAPCVCHAKVTCTTHTKHSTCAIPWQNTAWRLGGKFIGKPVESLAQNSIGNLWKVLPNNGRFNVPVNTNSWTHVLRYNARSWLSCINELNVKFCTNCCLTLAQYQQKHHPSGMYYIHLDAPTMEDLVTPPHIHKITIRVIACW